MEASEGPDSPTPDAAASARLTGSGRLGRVARSTLIPLAFGGSGLCVGLLVGLWRGVEAANDSGPDGSTLIGGGVASMISGLVAFVLHAGGGLLVGLVLGVVVVVGMSFKQRSR